MSTAARPLSIADRSSRVRLGCKGPGAEAWLASVGLAPAAGANRWQSVAGVHVLRLGLGEFLLTDGDDSAVAVIERLAGQISAQRPEGLYLVAREDVVLTLSGPALPALLRQVCNVDFSSLWRESTPTRGPVILTSMAGVAVTAFAEPTRGSAAPHDGVDPPALTLWVDPSFAQYFRHTLDEVAAGDFA